MRLKKAHTHIKNYNCNKTPLLHKKILKNRYIFLLWKCFCAARDLYAFSLLLHAMTIYYSIQIAGKLSFYSFKECLYALQHVYLYILGREVPMYTISIQTQQKKFLCYCYQLPWQWGRKFFRFSFIQTKRWSLTWKMRDEMKFFQWFILKVTFSVICYR